MKAVCVTDKWIRAGNRFVWWFRDFMVKTNAIRIIEATKAAHDCNEYDRSDGKIEM